MQFQLDNSIGPIQAHDKVNIFHLLVLHFEYTGKSRRKTPPNPLQPAIRRYYNIPLYYDYTVMTINITLKFFVVFFTEYCLNVQILKRTNIFDCANGGGAALSRFY